MLGILNMHFTFFSIAALVPIILACQNPIHDACAHAFTASSVSAASFCATYTRALSTATTGLPAFATACSLKPKKLSSACLCLKVATTLQTAVKTSVVVTSSSVAKITSSSVKIPTSPIAKTTPSSTSKVSPSSSAIASSSAGSKPSVPSTSSTSSLSALKTSSSSIAKISTSSPPIVQSTSSSSAVPKALPTTSATSSAAALGAPASCTASEYAQITAVVAACTNIVLENISAPASSTILLTNLKTGSTVTFAGKTTFGYTPNSDFNALEIAGTDVIITGAPGHVIDGNGPAYWDGQGSNGGTVKPDHFIVLTKMTNSVVSNLNIQNWPTHCFDITGCTGLTMTGITLDNSAGDAPNSASGSLPAAHNSDGFDLAGSNNIVLSNSVVKNQDDCVAVTSGENITVTGLTCSGGHGLSIGSVGGKSNNVVSNILFSDSSVISSQNGCRIKSNSGTTGSITGITYQNIVLSGITTYGIDVQQDYLNGGPTGDPTNGVLISDITFQNVTGTCTKGATDYYVLCGSGSCEGITFTDVAITGGGKASSCNFPSSGCPA